MFSFSAEALVDRENHAWEEILELLRQGTNAYTIIPAVQEAANDTLSHLQVSTKSYLGAVAYETGGIRWNEGWITLLGAGGPGIFGSLSSWNGLGPEPSVVTPEDGLLVVAYDAAGGFFALDTGKFGRSGLIYYFAPDTLEWESTDLQYSGFLAWLAEGDLNLFYQTFRWEGWQADMKRLEEGQVFAYYPPLWTAEGGGEASRKSPVSVAEAWGVAVREAK